MRALILLAALALTACAGPDTEARPIRFACWDNGSPTLVLPEVWKIELTQYQQTGVDSWRVLVHDEREGWNWVTHDSPLTEVCGPADPPPADETG